LYVIADQRPHASGLYPQKPYLRIPSTATERPLRKPRGGPGAARGGKSRGGGTFLPSPALEQVVEVYFRTKNGSYFISMGYGTNPGFIK